MMYSADKLNKQGDNIQPCSIPFPIWNQSIASCLVLTAASCPAYGFLRRQLMWPGIPISLRIFQFVVIHTVKVFGVVNNAKSLQSCPTLSDPMDCSLTGSSVNKAEVNIFLELSCFFDDPKDLES